MTESADLASQHNYNTLTKIDVAVGKACSHLGVHALALPFPHDNDIIVVLAIYHFCYSCKG